MMFVVGESHPFNPGMPELSLLCPGGAGPPGPIIGSFGYLSSTTETFSTGSGHRRAAVDRRFRDCTQMKTTSLEFATEWLRARGQNSDFSR